MVSYNSSIIISKIILKHLMGNIGIENRHKTEMYYTYCVVPRAIHSDQLRRDEHHRISLFQAL